MVPSGEDLQVHAVLFVFSGVEGPIGLHPVDRDERAVQDQVEQAVRCGLGQRSFELGGSGRQQRHRLVDVAPGGGGSDTETGAGLREGFPVLQVGQGHQRLHARW